MIDIPMKSKGAIDRSTIDAINNSRAPQNNLRAAAASAPAADTPAHVQDAAPPQITRQQTIPLFLNPVPKGRKLPICSASSLSCIQACFGWNTINPLCDVDVSAFLLGADGKVLGDSWFVFYGQTESPDESVLLLTECASDREMISIDFDRLNPGVQKIVFVLTINEAFEKKLHFGMMKDAYVRILNPSDRTEYVSFLMDDYYSNVISMMIGEIYRYNGVWKFNAVGNGVAKDLAGLCSLYGVNVDD